MANPDRSVQGSTDETEVADTVATTLENPHFDYQRQFQSYEALQF